MKMVRPFMELDKNGLFDKLIDDPELNPIFFNMYINMFMAVNNYKNVVKYKIKITMKKQQSK